MAANRHWGFQDLQPGIIAGRHNEAADRMGSRRVCCRTLKFLSLECLNVERVFCSKFTCIYFFGVNLRLWVRVGYHLIVQQADNKPLSTTESRLSIRNLDIVQNKSYTPIKVCLMPYLERYVSDSAKPNRIRIGVIQCAEQKENLSPTSDSQYIFKRTVDRVWIRLLLDRRSKIVTYTALS